MKTIYLYQNTLTKCLTICKNQFSTDAYAEMQKKNWDTDGS